MNNTKRRRLLMLVGIAVSILCLWLALRGTNFTEVWSALSRTNLWFVFPLLAALWGYFWLKANRWRLLLMPLSRVTKRDVFPAVMIGFAANLVLPAQLGELVRAHVASRQFSLKPVPVLATIILERMFDFLTVLLIVTTVLITEKTVLKELYFVAYAVGGIGSAIMVAAIAYVVWTDRFIAIFRHLFRFLPAALLSSLTSQMELGAIGLHSVKQPRLLLSIFFHSLAQWFLMGVCTYMSFFALNLSLPLSAGFVVLALNIVGMSVPSSPGFFGTIQVCFTIGLSTFGVSAADAFAASVFYHVFVFIPVVVLGVYYLRGIGSTFHVLASEADAADDIDAAEIDQAYLSDLAAPAREAAEKHSVSGSLSSSVHESLTHTSHQGGDGSR